MTALPCGGRRTTSRPLSRRSEPLTPSASARTLASSATLTDRRRTVRRAAGSRCRLLGCRSRRGEAPARATGEFSSFGRRERFARPVVHDCVTSDSYAPHAAQRREKRRLASSGGNGFFRGTSRRVRSMPLTTVGRFAAGRGEEGSPPTSSRSADSSRVADRRGASGLQPLAQLRPVPFPRGAGQKGRRDRGGPASPLRAKAEILRNDESPSTMSCLTPPLFEHVFLASPSEVPFSSLPGDA